MYVGKSWDEVKKYLVRPSTRPTHVDKAWWETLSLWVGGHGTQTFVL